MMYDGIRAQHKVAALRAVNNAVNMAPVNYRAESQLSNQMKDFSKRKAEATNLLLYPKIRAQTNSRIGDYRLNEQRNASTVDMVDAPIMVSDLRDWNNVKRDSAHAFPIYKRDKSINKSSHLPQTTKNNDYESPLRRLTNQTDLGKI